MGKFAVGVFTPRGERGYGGSPLIAWKRSGCEHPFFRRAKMIKFPDEGFETL
jgi:hypothetical protein